MSKIVTFGEAMLRLSAPHHQRLEQAESVEVYVGGSEFNVAVATSRLGVSTRWVSRLAANPLGRKIRNKANEHGVDTNAIVWCSDARVGLYWVELGASPRASSVVYDRERSAISRIASGEVNWEHALAGSEWFHVSGITPALSPTAAQVTQEALAAAKKAGCQVSYDLNYRNKLWTETEAQSTQEPLMEYVDVLVTTEEDTSRVFKITGETTQDDQFQSVSDESYAIVARKLADRFGFRSVAITLRENLSVWKNRWSAILLHEGTIYSAPWYELEIVDRLGAGDSFAAGLVYGLVEKQDPEYAVKFGVALSALKHGIPGDLCWVNKTEVETLMKGGGLRILR